MTTTDSSGYGATFPNDSTSETSKTDVAKEQASQVASSATEKAGQVAQTTKEQAQEVVAEATAQARNLAGELKTQVNEQAGTQRDRLVEQLRSMSDELTQMVYGGGSQSGVASEVASQLSTRAHDLAGYLDGKEPGDILIAVQNYARRKPGTFLIGAAVAGMVAGRLTRGARAAAASSEDSRQSVGYTPSYAPTSGYVPEIPRSTYPTTVSSTAGFSSATTLDEPGAAGYGSPAFGSDSGLGPRP